MLNKDLIAKGGANIGLDGENLTITFLSMNRASLSEKLLRSIRARMPGYKGKVLIIDNGSNVEELDKLRAVLHELKLDAKLVELGRNYGVSGGRNRTIPHVETDWIMFLDNDIYFVRNPLPRIQSDLSLLGCHFMSLPLLDPDGKTLFAKGGNIYVSFDDKHVHVGAGSVSPQVETSDFDGQGFLSTFLFGGACVLKKQSFLKLGGYDEAMFIGFEDIDFSIRLFQEGAKVGTTGAVALIHDHPKPVTTEDIEYERTRFTRDILHQAAKHLERKHGFQFWSTGVEFWLRDKHRSLDISAGAPLEGNDEVLEPALAPAQVHGKPKIALVVDSDHWAFANIARQIVKHLGHRFDFQIIPTEVVDNIDQILVMTADCAVTHFFWREYLNLVRHEFAQGYARMMGFKPDVFVQKYVRDRVITTSVYDHLFLSDDEIQARIPLFNELVKGYTVSSQRLLDIYKNIEAYPAPAELAEDGVDLSLFKPVNLERFNTLGQRTLVIGWAGNSKWAAGQGEDFKGFHSILKPAVEQLQQEGLDIRLELADRQQGFIAHKDMPAYYAKLDVYVCPSKIEGTPNPVLEAMACGVPVITTDVGVVPQALGNDPFSLILPERSIDALKERLKKFYAGGHPRRRRSPGTGWKKSRNGIGLRRSRASSACLMA
ncbi:glycosyltransferase [Alcaligenes sp. Marseille-Q7550]